VEQQVGEVEEEQQMAAVEGDEEVVDRLGRPSRSVADSDSRRQLGLGGPVLMYIGWGY
jgi:hypothetical protein